MKTVQAYVQGTRHVRQGKVCQDRTAFLNENNVYAVALSDGAGSPQYTFSEYGAEVVTDTVTRFFCKNFDRFYEGKDERELAMVLIAVLLKELKKKSEELGADSVVRLSSTLLSAAVKDDKVIICHLGDGAIGAVTAEDSRVISCPENGEFANSTYFVTGNKAAEHLKIIRKTIQDELGFFLMSDGTADYCYDDRNNCFRDGARKMALVAYDKDSDKLPEKTIVEKMIADDTNSDDCSFISLMLADRYSYEGKIPEPERNLKMAEVYGVKNAMEKKNVLPVIIAVAILIMVIAAVSLIFIQSNKRADDNGQITESIETTEEAETEEIL